MDKSRSHLQVLGAHLEALTIRRMQNQSVLPHCARLHFELTLSAIDTTLTVQTVQR